MSSEPECKCFYPANHEPGCVWKAWKDDGCKPIVSEPEAAKSIASEPEAAKCVILNIALIDPDLTLHLDPQRVQGLCDSIRKHGVVNPISVTRMLSGRYRIIDGFHRYTAAKQLGHLTIPANIVRIVNP